jgi:26S proteasome regulatory subunit N7
MAPYYESLCKDLKWQLDTDLLNKMKKANEDELKRLDDVLEDAEKNLGESEIRDAMMARAEYLIRIGNKVSLALISYYIQSRGHGVRNHVIC